MYPTTFRPSQGSQAILVPHKFRVSDCRAPPPPQPPQPFIPPTPGESGSTQNLILLDVDVDEHPLVVEVDAAQPKFGIVEPLLILHWGQAKLMHNTYTKKLSYVKTEEVKELEHALGYRLRGRRCIELANMSYIVGSTGYTSTIKYKGK
ncbi:hypothetical protein K523DRAFT_326815, partial [Schizophyllum commune Tattone D]